MERPATVARSNLADAETNVNRLRIPEIGIAAFYVSAGSKSSKTYLQPGAKAPAAAAVAGNDGFNFVPAHETVKIEYELNDLGAVINELTLEIFRRFEKDPIWKIDLHKLGPSWLYHGKHEVSWDGRLIKEADLPGTVGDKTTHDLTKAAPEPVKDKFPDGYITLEHSPYKLKLTASSALLPKKPVVAWTHLQILLKSIEIELGPEEAIPKLTDDRLVMDKALRKVIEKAKVPAKGGKLDLKLPSNIFKTSSAEMNDNTAFTEYQKMWGKGLQIPLIARIRLQDSRGGEVKLEKEKGAVALGAAKFLWEWEDPDEVGTNGAGKPHDFIAAAIDYYKSGADARSAAKDHTYPKGDNCHVDRGGKRGPDADPVFPDQAGYPAQAKLDAEKFPFKVEACKTRKWSAFSTAWTSGKLAGHTGVLFSPSRMAGDDYRVKVYLAWDHDKKGDFVLDAKDEPLKAAPAIQAETGVFHIRREMDLVRYVRKKSSIADFVSGNLGGIQSGYATAYMDVNNKIDGSNKYTVSDHKLANRTALDYNAVVETAISGATEALVKNHVVCAATANHAGEDSTFKIRAYADFVRELYDQTHTAASRGADETAYRAANPGKTANDLMEGLGTMALPAAAGLPTGTPVQVAYKDYVTRATAIQNTLVAKNVKDAASYSGAMTFKLPRQAVLDGMEMLSGGKSAAAADGVTILHFNYIHTFVRDRLNAGLGDVILQGEAVSVNDGTRNRVVFVFYQSDLATFNHEVGHHLFLPHAKHNGPLNTMVPGGFQVGRHDDDDTGCTMSYSDVRPAFCGLCQLRLRGWSALALDKDDANNKKP